MKAYRICPSCSKEIHVKRNPCFCGHVFVKSVKQENQPTRAARPATTDPLSVAAPTLSHANAPATLDFNELKELNGLRRRVEELQNHNVVLEKEIEEIRKYTEKSISEIRTHERAFYNYQCQLIYQRAFEYFGGKGDLYYSEHGDNPELFKQTADEEGVFIPPQLPDLSHEYPSGNPSDKTIKEAAAIVLTHRVPQERDLTTPDRILEDPNSLKYTNFTSKAKKGNVA